MATSESATNILIHLAGGVALLIWAVRLVRTGAMRAFGSQLRHALQSFTRNRFAAFASGVVVTMVLQSSTATTLLVSSFAGQALIGSAMALRQARLKLLVAYSTVAQLGYLFLVFPLGLGSGAAPFESTAWTAGALQLMAHAFAKAAMFMAAGLVYEAIGHDRIAEFRGLGRIAPLTVLTMTLASISLMGLPPSGGFSAKWLMLTAAFGEGAWWWVLVIAAGGLLAAGYVFRILVPAFTPPEEPIARVKPVVVRREAAALALAVIAILIGFLPLAPWPLLAIGRIAAGAP